MIFIIVIKLIIIIVITMMIRCRAVNSAGESSELRTVELSRPEDLVEQLVIYNSIIIIIFMISLIQILPSLFLINGQVYMALASKPVVDDHHNLII